MKRWLFLLILIVVGCKKELPATAVPATDKPVLTKVPATATDMKNDVEPIQLTVLYTNDEHGWVEGRTESQSAANLMGLWREEGLGDGNVIVLSGGDNWTGPAISTWFEGESMIEVMNEMEYTASAIGNHEFDFGLDALQMRVEEADFHYLSANIRYKEDGSLPTDLGIEPYAIVEVGDLRIGIIGLTTTATPVTTLPENVADFEFINYGDALEEIVPLVQAEGVDLILVPAHICWQETLGLASRVQDMGVNMIGGGHCNELAGDVRDGIALVEGGSFLESYGKVVFTLDGETHAVLNVEVETMINEGGQADAVVAAVVDKWRSLADEELNVVIGYLESDIGRHSDEMFALLSEAWLLGYPQADISICNQGSFRQGLPAGDLTFGDMIGTLPFDNVLIEAELTGAEIEGILVGKIFDVAVGGMHRDSFEWVLDATGEPLVDDQTYTVMVNNFMYGGGDGFNRIAHYDPDAYNTAIDWRQPIFDWIIDQQSTPDRPLDEIIADLWID